MSAEVTKDTYEVVRIYLPGRSSHVELKHQANTSPGNLFRVSAAELSRWIKKLSSLIITLKSEGESMELRQKHVEIARYSCLQNNSNGFILKF